MTTEEIHEKIQSFDHEEDPCIIRLLVVLERMNNKIGELEKRIEDNERTAYHANNVASCLANGIIPD